MKKQMLMLVVLAAVGAANAGVIWTDSFDEPSVPIHADDPTKFVWNFHGYNVDGDWPGWVGSGLKYAYIYNVPGSGIDLLNVDGDQVMGFFNNLPGEDTNIAATTTADNLDVAIAANTTYSLALKTAADFPEFYPQDYHVQLIAIGESSQTVLAEAYGPVADNDFLTQGNQIALSYETGANPTNLGERIAVRLRKGEGVYYHNVYYDDLVLSAEVIPEPATMCLLGLGGLLIRRRRA
jgi:hypothetical protein